MNTDFFHDLHKSAKSIEREAQKLSDDIKSLETQFNQIILNNPLYNQTPRRACSYKEES